MDDDYDDEMMRFEFYRIDDGFGDNTKKKCLYLYRSYDHHLYDQCFLRKGKFSPKNFLFFY